MNGSVLLPRYTPSTAIVLFVFAASRRRQQSCCSCPPPRFRFVSSSSFVSRLSVASLYSFVSRSLYSTAFFFCRLS
jgi:hypothetical protein